MNREAIDTVLIMYPDNRTTGKTTFKEISIPPSLLAIQFRQTTERLLTRYHRHGFQVVRIVFDDFNGNYDSYLYPVSAFDQTLKIGIGLSEWTRDRHHDLLQGLVSMLSYPQTSRFVIGGFHANDCVVEMTRSLRQFNYQADPDILLTDILKQYIVEHKLRRAMGRTYTREDRSDGAKLLKELGERVFKSIEA
ncbi:MAG: hypothetical protein M1607_00980 [Patescibacteria group bacterium]|nr:hypothetical protein [Patescibacteria group bacterium]